MKGVKLIKKFILFLIILIIFESSIASQYIEKISPTSSKNIPLDFEQFNFTFNSNNYTLYGEIFSPLKISEKYPLIVFCEGYHAFTENYHWLVKNLTKEGYIVMIFDYPGQGRSEGIFFNNSVFFSNLNFYIRPGIRIENIIHFLSNHFVVATMDAITYLLKQSPVKDEINKNLIGIIGHSLGAITAIQTIAIDERIKCAIAISESHPICISSCQIPIQFQGGDCDIGYHSLPFLYISYFKSNNPKEIIIIEKGTHEGFTNSRYPCPKWQKELSFQYSLAWFDYFLKEKSEAFDFFTKGNTHLSNIFKSRYNMGDGDKILSS